MRKKKYTPVKTSKAVNKLAARAVSYAMVSEVYRFVVFKDQFLNTEDLAKKLDKLALAGDLVECGLTILTMFFGKNYERDIRDIVDKYIPDIYNGYHDDEEEDTDSEFHSA